VHLKTAIVRVNRINVNVILDVTPYSLVSRDYLRHLRLLQWLKCILPSSALLNSVRWFDTDVSGLPIVPSSSVKLSLEGGTNR
jgi:hypothetical protein